MSSVQLRDLTTGVRPAHSVTLLFDSGLWQQVVVCVRPESGWMLLQRLDYFPRAGGSQD